MLKNQFFSIFQALGEKLCSETGRSSCVFACDVLQWLDENVDSGRNERRGVFSDWQPGSPDLTVCDLKAKFL